MFSSRVPSDLTPNGIGRSLVRLRSFGIEVTDLTESNPTRVGLKYPEGLLDGLSKPSVLEYKPESLGLFGARVSVSSYLKNYGIKVNPKQVVITSSSSDSYASLFKLLCNPGEAVLVPRPSYPLFEHLTKLEGVEAMTYTIEYQGRWKINFNDLRKNLTPQVRAILIVNPNNPTGSFISTEDFEAIIKLCHENKLALIADEVFGFYPLTSQLRGPSVLDYHPNVLSFVLGGLSKAVGLPQLKLGWIITDGPPALTKDALKRLEFICDTYLSVGTPVQLAVDEILKLSTLVTEQISQRIRQNYKRLWEISSQHSSTRLLPIDGGWYAVVQVRETKSEEILVLDLLEQEHVLVHPGYFFDFPNEAFLVMSLLPMPDVFEDAVTRVLAHCRGE